MSDKGDHGVMPTTSQAIDRKNDIKDETGFDNALSVSAELDTNLVIPLLLQDFFGLKYLPRQSSGCIQTNLNAYPVSILSAEVENSKEEAASTLEVMSTNYEVSTYNATQEDVSTIASLDENDSLDNLESNTSKDRGKRIQKFYGVFRSRLKKSGSPHHSRIELDSVDQIDTQQKEIGLEWIHDQMVSLSSCRENLCTIEKEAINVQKRMEFLCDEIRASKIEISVLEDTLAKSVQKLQNHYIALEEANHDFKTLSKKQEEASKTLKSTSTRIQRSIPRHEAGASVLTPVKCSSSSVRKTQSESKKQNSISGIKSIGKNRNDVLNRGTQTDFSELVNAEENQKEKSADLTQHIHSELHILKQRFIRVHDLDLSSCETDTLDPTSTKSKKRTSEHQNHLATRLLFDLEQGVGVVLEGLIRYGYIIVTDESDRFCPQHNTERILAKTVGHNNSDSWSIRPWHCTIANEVLVWQCTLQSSVQTGKILDIPVLKARGIVKSSPESVVELLTDNSRVSEYNKMNQGRWDLLTLQKGLHTTRAESAFSVPGEARILRSINRPPMIKRNIEMITLSHVRVLCDSQPGKSFISVSRSMWENDTGTIKAVKDTTRSEMLLGVNLFRAIEGPDGECHCELTTITQLHAPGVPEMLSKRVAPTHAVGFIKEIQSVFAR